jgi:hypothetical protein
MLANTGLSLQKAQARLDGAERREKILEAERAQANERLAGILTRVVSRHRAKVAGRKTRKRVLKRKPKPVKRKR